MNEVTSPGLEDVARASDKKGKRRQRRTLGHWHVGRMSEG